MSHRYRKLNKYKGEIGTPEKEPVTSYREEMLVPPSSRIADDEIDLNIMMRATSEGTVLKTRNKCLRNGTWSVRALYQLKKLENLLYEMENMHLDIIGVAEAHWTE